MTDFKMRISTGILLVCLSVVSGALTQPIDLAAVPLHLQLQNKRVRSLSFGSSDEQDWSRPDRQGWSIDLPDWSLPSGDSDEQDWSRPDRQGWSIDLPDWSLPSGDSDKQDWSRPSGESDTPRNTVNCSGQASVCSSCTTVQRCFLVGTTYQPGNTVQCAANTPYCADGQCTATLPANSTCNTPQPSSTFKCPSDNQGGYYPDPSDRRKFHFCTGGQAYDDDCLAYPGTVYRQASTMCERKSGAPEDDDAVFSCPTNKIGVYQTYLPAPNVYYICVDTDVKNVLMAKCPPHYVINGTDPTHPVCRVSCDREGRLPDPTDPTRYDECVQLGWRTFSAPIPKVCPGGVNFDAETQQCVPVTTAAATTQPPTTARP